MLPHRNRHWLRFEPGVGGRLVVGTGRRTARGWVPEAHESSFDGQAHELDTHDIPLRVGNLAFASEADAAEYAMKLAVMLINGTFKSGPTAPLSQAVDEAANERFF